VGEGRPGKAGKDRHIAHLAPEKSRKPLRQSVFFRRTGLHLDPKINFGVCETSARDRLLYCGQWWTTNMRVFALGLILCGVAVPCLAQTVLKSEPLVLAPYEIAFVQDASCPVGKVLKVTGAIRGLHRRKACVALAAEQASLAKATP
jgi:hypothetical protein